MDVLTIILSASAVFTVISLVVAIATFVVTLVTNARGRRSARNEAALIQTVSGYIGESIDLDTLLTDINARAPGDVVVVLDKVAALVSGSAHNTLKPLLNHPDVKAILLAQLNRTHPQSQILAARLLADVPDQQVIAALQRQLQASNPLSRLAAALALVRLDAIGSTTDLIERLAIDTEAQSYGLIILFRELLNRDIFELVELLHADVPEFIKTLGIDALGHSGNYSALQSLMMFAENDSVVLRLHALKALNKLQHPGAAPAVEAGLSDISAAVRNEAAVCAGALQLPQTRPDLERLLDDPDWTVRFNAAQALIKIGEAGQAVLVNHQTLNTPGGLIARQILAEHEAA
jgi:hypothetical protein